MFKDVRRYPGYVDRPGAAVASVPEQWGARRLKTVLREVDRRSATGTERLLSLRAAHGLVDHEAAGGRPIPAAALTGFKVVEPGDLVMNRMRAATGVFGLAKGRGLVSPDYAVFGRTAPCELGYVLALLRTPQVAHEMRRRSRGMGTGESGFLRLYSDSFGAMSIPWPTGGEQASIVKYLAHAHRRIDRAIAAKRKLIALLEEQRQATAVARLDWATVDRRAMTRLKDVATVQTGLTLGKAYAEGEVAEYPYLRVANVQAGSLDLRRLTSVAVPSREAARCVLRPGDVLMTEGGDIDKLGRATLWRGEVEQCLHQNHIFAVRCGQRLDPEYLVLALAQPRARQYFAVTAKKTTNLASTNSTTVREFPFYCPPLDQQAEIVRSVTIETATADAAIDRTRREIELLREFRTRLTSDVVTGQLDVRHIAATLPDLDPEEPTDDVGPAEDDLVDEAAEFLEGVDA